MTQTEKRLQQIERSVGKYGCFDLTEEDVYWLIHQIRRDLTTPKVEWGRNLLGARPA